MQKDNDVNNKVTLEYKVFPQDVYSYGGFRDFEKLKHYAQNCCSNYYSIYVKCKVNDGISPELITDELHLYVATKLLYPDDIRKILIDNYGNVLDFEHHKYNDNEPIWFNGIQTQAIERIDENGHFFTKIVHFFSGWRLTQKDIVTDKNLHQIWPTETGQYPTPLVELLSRTGEKIK